MNNRLPDHHQLALALPATQPLVQSTPTPVYGTQNELQSGYKLPMRKLLLLLIWLGCALGFTAYRAQAATYYISPTGNDEQNGTTESQPWATFARAWQTLLPGDTLVLMDGLYRQNIEPNGPDGTADAPITIRAQHDGQVIIDPNFAAIPVFLYRSYYIIEGLIARNGQHAVYYISGSNNILRRVSGYDATADDNSDIFTIYDSHHNLVEDCIAAGMGRKMVMIYRGSHNIVRRCFTDWRAWDGRTWCDDWPWGDNLQIYNSDYNIIENSIGYGSVPVWSVAVQANAPDVSAVGNQVLGTISIYAGMNHDGTVKVWPAERPQPTECTQLRSFDWPSQRAGFALYGNGRIEDNLFRDIFAWGSAGLGLTVILDGQHRNNLVDHATLLNNGLDNRPHWGGIGAEVRPEELPLFAGLTNSWIEDYDEWGAGARLDYRYVNGQLTTEPLWPWPMEARVQAELGLSPTSLVESVRRQWHSAAYPLQPFIRNGRLLTALPNRCDPMFVR